MLIPRNTIRKMITIRSSAMRVGKSLLFHSSLAFLSGTVLLGTPKKGHADIPLQVKETLGISRTAEMVHNGIPVAREEGWLSTTNLIIEDEEGTQIPATFEVLSRWAGGKDDTSQPIQWLLVTFPATLNAYETANYSVKTGSPVSPTAVISLTDNGSSYTINTGTAQFVIGKTGYSFFDAISRGGNMLAQGNGGSNSTVAGQSEAAALAPRNIVIERQNDHYVVIKIEGDYGNTPIGASPNDAPLSYKTRYEFFASSPTAIVTHKFFWAGSGSDSSNGRPSGDYHFTVDNVSLALPDMLSFSAADVYADQSTFLTSATAQQASIAQKRKTLFSDPSLAELTNGSDSASTVYASQPMLINRSTNGSLAVSIDHMKYFEPQSIETDGGGKITINVMAEPQYFADYQGTWARVGISALPQTASYSETVRYNFAPLNQRLFAFPVNEYTVRTNVFDELASTPNATCAEPLSPSSPPEQKVQCYYDKVREVTTETKIYLEDQVKDDSEESDFRGLMTWGSMAGYRSLLGTEPTWDKIYSGAWNTDYHNGWNNVNYQFAMEGDAAILYDFSFMAARRMLHTQIIQPSWENQSGFMGWGYAGYHYYRSDPNSSHSYFENLLNYYYLTGDMEVIDIVKVGAKQKSMDYTRDSGGNLNDPLTGGVAWVDRVDRRGMQAAKMFQFIGHTYDADYLDDFVHIFNQAFTRSLALLNDGTGVEYGFLSTNQDTTSGFNTEQTWMLSLYFMNYLYQLYSEFGDLEIGQDNIRISRGYEAVARGFKQYLNPSNGAWDQQWFNQFRVNYSGDRIGGTITSIEGTNTSGNPLYFYNSGKYPVITVLLRTGKMAADDGLTNFGFDGIDWALAHETFQDIEDDLWGKISGGVVNRFHNAMAYLEYFSISTPSSLPYAKVGTNYSQTLAARGGTPPYSNWQVISGSLPDGLDLNTDTGAITGTPTVQGRSTFTVQVQDSSSPDATTSKELNITVNPPASSLLLFIPAIQAAVNERNR